MYDAFFKGARGLTEVACMMHARRYFFKALDLDQERMGRALHLIACLYAVEDRAKGLGAEERLALRKRLSVPVMAKLNKYLLKIQDEVLPKSPAGKAVRYALNQWEALSRFLEDGDLEIDNGATERANRDVAIGRGNWTFFGSDNGGRTAAILMRFIARVSVVVSSHSPGSAKYCRASPHIPCIGSLNYSRITGNLSRVLPTPNIRLRAMQGCSRDAYHPGTKSVLQRARGYASG